MITDDQKWRKSSRSPAGDNCVEVAITADLVGVRDSKRRDGGNLVLTHGQWTDLLTRVKDGELDLPPTT